MSGWQGVYLHDIAEELKKIREILENQLTTEQSSMVDIVRCKDCKYHEMRKGDYLYFCNAHSDTEMPFEVEPNGFCNLGKREEIVG